MEKIRKLKTKDSVLMRVVPEFRTDLKLKAVESGQTILELTAELSKSKKRNLRRDEYFVKL